MALHTYSMKAGLMCIFICVGDYGVPLRVGLSLMEPAGLSPPFGLQSLTRGALPLAAQGRPETLRFTLAAGRSRREVSLSPIRLVGQEPDGLSYFCLRLDKQEAQTW